MAEKKEPKVSELVYIQYHLKAPKDLKNNFGGYMYRSAEQILEAVKPLLKETNCVLTISDEIIQISDRIYVKATATLKTSGGEVFTTSAFAREPLAKKGIDESQVTGSASSYARKYALNGLFCIDDNKDADYLNTSKEYSQPVSATPVQQTVQQPVPSIQQILEEIDACTTTDALKGIWNKYPTMRTNASFTGALTAKKDKILNNGKS